MKPLRGGAQGLRRDRLHHPLDQHLAGRRVHSAAADGRHHRPPVSRVRGHDHHGIAVSAFVVADVDADDGLALSAQREGDEARRLLRDRPSAASTSMLHVYERGLDFVLRHQFAHAAACSSRRWRSPAISSSSSRRASSRSRTPGSSSAYRRPARTFRSPR